MSDRVMRFDTSGLGHLKMDTLEVRSDNGAWLKPVAAAVTASAAPLTAEAARKLGIQKMDQSQSAGHMSKQTASDAVLPASIPSNSEGQGVADLARKKMIERMNAPLKPSK